MDRLERRFLVEHRCNKVKNLRFIKAIFFNDNSTVSRNFRDCFLTTFDAVLDALLILRLLLKNLTF